MKKKKTNIYISYFRSYDTILTQAQKRMVLTFMMFAGMFVLRTIFGFALEFLYAGFGMVSLALLISYFLTEWISTDNLAGPDTVKNIENH